MIPHGLMTAETDIGEIRIMELSVFGFTFRLPVNERYDIKRVIVHFYMIPEQKDVCATLAKFRITEEERTRYYVVYRLETEEPVYSFAAKAFMKMYETYVRMKTVDVLWQNRDGEKAEELYYPNLDALRKAWSLRYQLPEHFCDAKEIALSLSDPKLIERYLEVPFDVFRKEYFEERYMKDHPAAQAIISCLYIGNRFCSHLLPDIYTIRNVLSKARTEGLWPVICIPPIPERMIDTVSEILSELARDRCMPEVEGNDWGILSLLRSEQYKPFVKTAGIHICKRRKDTRVKSLPGNNMLPAETAIDAPFYREWMWEHFGIKRFTYECGLNARTTAEDTVLFWPVMQMNSSGHCTLKAVCENGMRGMQIQSDKCRMYCLNNIFIYPERLDTIGKYNSLFGLDVDSCTLSASRIVIDIP